MCRFHWSSLSNIKNDVTTGTTLVISDGASALIPATHKMSRLGVLYSAALLYSVTTADHFGRPKHSGNHWLRINAETLNLLNWIVISPVYGTEQWQIKKSTITNLSNIHAAYRPCFSEGFTENSGDSSYTLFLRSTGVPAAHSDWV